jgi:hypothetical protein
MSQLRKNSELTLKNSELTLKKLDPIQAELNSIQAELKLWKMSQQRDKLFHYQQLASIMADIVSETVAEPASRHAYVWREHITNARDVLRKLEWTVALRNGKTRPPIPPKDLQEIQVPK